MSDPLIDLFREAGLNRMQSTLADVHEWAARRIVHLEAERIAMMDTVDQLQDELIKMKEADHA